MLISLLLSFLFASLPNSTNKTDGEKRLFYFSRSDTSTKDHPITDYTALLRLDAAFEDWKEELPPHIQYLNLQKSADVNDLFVRQAHLLHHR